MSFRPTIPTTGLKVGLLGGSFNPAHEGHRLVSLMALQKIGLDQVWWLVSPQNPLKPVKGMAPLDERMTAARAMARHPRIIVTDLEAGLGTRFTIDTVRALRERAHGTRFVWLMGADNMLQLPRWAKWRALVESIPMAIYPRPGFGLKARLSPASMAYRRHWVDASDARILPHLEAPALCFLEGPENPVSATEIRENAAGKPRKPLKLI